ncbi:gibberellin 20 oxidase 2-like [Aristolochia californica]|uniref:gibberellin 20 oxidase 2-like n=1 Tax=Aristolochia californica TaxID=171875 RepID=UPI0035DCE508
MDTEEIEKQSVDSLSSMGAKLSVKDFIWCPEEWPNKTNDANELASDEIPVISLSAVQGDGYDHLCTKMVEACEEWGFFKLVDHGVSSEIVENMKERCTEFFDLGMEQKMKGARSGSLPLGYSASNLDYGSNLPWAEILQLLHSPQQVVYFSEKVYGDQYQRVSNAIIDYMNALDQLGMRILEMLARGLGLCDDFFTKNFKDMDQTMIRVNRYPPCPLPEKCLGLGSHSDPHTLTILLQDEVSGLQIQKNDGQWVGIRPVQDSFVINIGDTLEAWTNGRLKSVVHRAIVNKEKKRLSAAYFLSPTADTLIECPSHLVDGEGETHRKYASFTWGDFRKELLKQRRVTAKTALKRYLLSG